MKALRFRMNKEPSITAGLPGFAGVHVIVDAVVRRVDPKDPESPTRRILRVSVGGLAQPHESVAWVSRALKVGDQMTITVVETESPDAPRWRTDLSKIPEPPRRAARKSKPAARPRRKA